VRSWRGGERARTGEPASGGEGMEVGAAGKGLEEDRALSVCISEEKVLGLVCMSEEVASVCMCGELLFIGEPVSVCTAALCMNVRGIIERKVILIRRPGSPSYLGTR